MSIEYRGDNKYRFRVRKDGINYSQNFIYDDKPLTEKEIKEKTYPKAVTDAHKQFEVDVMRENVGYDENMKFFELSQLVLDEYVKPNLRANSEALFISLVNNHLIPAFGDKSISKIKPLDIQKMLNEKAKTLSPNTVRGIFREANKIFNKAIEWKLIINNPCKNIKLPKVAKTNYRELLSNEDINKLIAAINNQPLMYKTIFSIALYSGIRQSEILGLHTKDIKGNSIIVNKQFNYIMENGKRKRQIVDTKTDNSIRTVYIPKFLTDIIKEYISSLKIVSKEGILFYNQVTKKPYTRKMVAQNFDEMLALNNIPDIRFHDLRHLYATMALNSGASIVSVAKNMGDTIETVLKNYTHGIEEEQQKAAYDFGEYIDKIKDLPKICPGGKVNEL